MKTFRLFAASVAVATLTMSAAIPAKTLPRAAASAHARFVDPDGAHNFPDGAHNFRDVGGYRTADGHTVRWGVLYRSGVLAGLTAAGQARAAALGLQALVDLRSTGERTSQPDPAMLAPHRWAQDYQIDQSGFKGLAGPNGARPDAVRAMMIAGYRIMPHQQARAYRELFAELIRGDTPVLVHCSAGKDRTGVGVALVLTALGVPYATVRDDFLLSNRAAAQNATSGPLASLPPESA
ncbi:MAG: tyrosine-protein phosphatase, partial [Novosphingobium sp.]|nr:tyrosine-protein phosphatase [Novosphingobium sp.]